MSLPIHYGDEALDLYVRRLVAALEARARRQSDDLVRAQDSLLRELFPVGALYLTALSAPPAPLSRLGTWTDAATAAARGSSLSAHIFERLT